MREVSKDAVYPLPLFVRLMVNDLMASSTWYEKLGFEVSFTMKGMGDQPVAMFIRWMKYADIMLVQSPKTIAKQPEDTGIAIYLNALNEVEDVARRAPKGSIIEGPTVRPWNAKELILRDPDGYQLIFSEPADKNKTFDEVMENVKNNVA